MNPTLTDFLQPKQAPGQSLNLSGSSTAPITQSMAGPMPSINEPYRYAPQKEVTAEDLRKIKQRKLLEKLLFEKAVLLRNGDVGSVPANTPFDATSYSSNGKMLLPGTNDEVGQTPITAYSKFPTLVEIDIPEIFLRDANDKMVDAVGIRLQEDLRTLDPRAQVKVGTIVYWLIQLMKRPISADHLVKLQKDVRVQRMLAEGKPLVNYGDAVAGLGLKSRWIEDEQYFKDQASTSNVENPHWRFLIQDQFPKGGF